MKIDRKTRSQRVRAVSAVAGMALLITGGSAGAASDSCREWRYEHSDWQAEVMHRYLTGAPQREIDGALFEMLQREAYLTSCDVSAQGSRGVLVGWRLVGRNPDEYGSAVLESVLERAGFDVGLRSELRDVVAPPSAPMNAPGTIANTAMNRGHRGELHPSGELSRDPR